MRGGEIEYYFAKKYSSCIWTGIDINDENFRFFYNCNRLDNVILLKGDMFSLNEEMIGKCHPSY